MKKKFRVNFLKIFLILFGEKFLARTCGLKIVTGINTRVRKNFIPVLQVYVIFSDWGCNYIKKNGLGGSTAEVGGI
jgi:hypothetical protein